MNPSWGFKLGGGFRYPFDELYDDRLWYFPKASEIVEYHMSHAQVDYFVIQSFGVGIGIEAGKDRFGFQPRYPNDCHTPLFALSSALLRFEIRLE